MATTVRITGDYNPTSSKRVGTVTFTNSDGVTAMVAVTQEGYVGSDTHTLTINLLTDTTGKLSLTLNGESYGSFSITPRTPYVDEFAHGAVVGWTIDPILTVSGLTYDSASGEVTMTSDQTVNVRLSEELTVD